MTEAAVSVQLSTAQLMQASFLLLDPNCSVHYTLHIRYSLPNQTEQSIVIGANNQICYIPSALAAHSCVQLTAMTWPYIHSMGHLIGGQGGHGGYQHKARIFFCLTNYTHIITRRLMCECSQNYATCQLSIVYQSQNKTHQDSDSHTKFNCYRNMQKTCLIRI